MVSNEQELVERIQRGEQGAFQEFVERYKKKVYYMAYDLTSNHHDAEDLSQEVFIKVYRSLKGFRGESRLNSWLYRITINAHLNKKRKKSLSAMELQEDFSQAQSDTNLHGTGAFERNPEHHAAASVVQKHIDQALEKLSPRERSVFVLRHYKEMSLKEVAATLEISEGTVKSLLFRSLRKMQGALAFYRQELGLEP